MTNLNEELLSEDPDSLAIEADEESVYDPTPDPDSHVVVTEPKIISVGRSRRKDALRNLPPEQR